MASASNATYTRATGDIFGMSRIGTATGSIIFLHGLGKYLLEIIYYKKRRKVKINIFYNFSGDTG